MKPLYIFLLATGLIILVIVFRNWYIKRFIKNLKPGTRIKFHIAEEKYYGEIIRVDEVTCEVSYIDYWGTNARRPVLKHNIYPSW
jgi:hypothetical protein